MADSVNLALDDEMMAQATGGITDTDPYGYVCEATVIKSLGTASDRTLYSVDADNGRTYQARWRYRSILNKGERVQLIHADDGTYELEPILD
ncbi:MAG: hypothetical protein K6E90_02680 [Lachnospiraceae bacterium]|nr:hypothetical protein [Lachnospiraceae bacterium]